MKRILLVGLLAMAAISLFASTALAQGAGGVTGPAFYVDGELYRTVGTPTDLEGTGAPGHSFDTIYAFGDEQMNVAEAAPGDDGYNGGRWKVEGLMFDDTANDGDDLLTYDEALAEYDDNSSNTFDSAEEIEAAIDDGAVTSMVVRYFVCPVIPVPAAS